MKSDMDIKSIESLVNGRTQIFEFNHNGQLVERVVIPDNNSGTIEVETDCLGAIDTFKKLRGIS